MFEILSVKLAQPISEGAFVFHFFPDVDPIYLQPGLP